VAIHQLEAELEVYGAAAFLILVHIVRNLAARDAKSKRDMLRLLEQAALDGERLGDQFGRDVATLVRRVLTMKPLIDPRAKH